MLYPLKFAPRLVEKIWGGRKIQDVLGKSLPHDQLIGESWELYDFPPGTIEKSDKWVSSVVSNGPLKGMTLHDLVGQFGHDLCGEVPLLAQGQFPILIKFLDARENLSVQVHPDAAYAAAHPGANLKTEAWYVVQSDPGAKLYRGLRPSVTRESFAAAIADGTVEDLIRAIDVRAGDCFFLPSGTIHALGAGILVAEVQTPSDTTFRVFDFNRIDPSTGKPRQLHVEQALECIDFSGAAEAPRPRKHVAGAHTTATRLAACEFFTMEKVRFREGVDEPIPYDQPVVWMVLEGSAEIRVSGMNEPTLVGRGDTVLLPARMDKPLLRTLSDCVWIEVTFPA